MFTTLSMKLLEIWTDLSLILQALLCGDTCLISSGRNSCENFKYLIAQMLLSYTVTRITCTPATPHSQESEKWLWCKECLLPICIYPNM